MNYDKYMDEDNYISNGIVLNQITLENNYQPPLSGCLTDLTYYNQKNEQSERVNQKLQKDNYEYTKIVIQQTEETAPNIILSNTDVSEIPNELSTQNGKNKKHLKQNILKCNVIDCQNTYASISGLNNHMRKKHQGQLVYSCDECPKQFKTTQDRTMHKINDHNGRRFQSPKSNNNNKVKEKIFTCKITDCEKKFNKEANLNRHMSIHNAKNKTVENTETHPCPDCSKIFYTMDMYNEHRNLFHNENIKKYHCNDCSKEFLTKRKLNEHSIIHKERIMFKCEVCNKVFVRSQTLQHHRITCKAAYPCDECVDSFMTKDSLIKHQLLHNNTKFICNQCNKIFINQLLLDLHKRRHSLRINYTCHICKEILSTRSNFYQHLKKHLETNLQCNICNEKFTNLVRYGYHKAEMHGSTRPYECILCDDNFCTRNELFLHLHNHNDVNTSNTSYMCELCSLKFSTKDNYEQHKRSHSDNKEITNNNLNTNVNHDKDKIILDSNINKNTLRDIPVKCLLCKQLFENDNVLKNHTKFCS